MTRFRVINDLIVAFKLKIKFHLVDESLSKIDADV